MTSSGDVIQISENDNSIILDVQTPSPLISPTDSNNSVSVKNEKNSNTIRLPCNFKENTPSDEVSSAASSLTELKRFLRDLPSPNEVRELTDRVAALNRQKRRNRDVYLHLQDSANRIEEKDEKEEREAKNAVLETETPANNFPKAEKLRDARARRRARIQAEDSQAQNKEMVVTQRDSTNATSIVNCDERCEKSNTSVDGLVNISMNEEVNFNETTALDLPHQVESCESWDVSTIKNDYHEIVRENFHPDIATTVTARHALDKNEHSQKKNETYLTQMSDTTCRNCYCELQCEGSIQELVSTNFTGYRPRGVILKNLSSEGETEINSIMRNNSVQSMNDLKQPSPPSKLQRNIGNINFVSAKSEPTSCRRNVLHFPCPYMGNESTTHEGSAREMSSESLRASRYQQPNKGNCTVNTGATKSMENNLTKQLDYRHQRLDLVSLLSRNIQQKESNAISSRSMPSESSEISSLPQMHRGLRRSQLCESAFMTDMQMYKHKAVDTQAESTNCSKTIFKEDIKKVSHSLDRIDREVPNTLFHLHSNAEVTTESSTDTSKGINGTKRLQPQLTINTPDSFRKLNVSELSHRNEPFNSLKSLADHTKRSVKIRDSRNKNSVNVKDIKENCPSSFDKGNSSLVTSNEIVYVADPHSLEDVHNSVEKSGTNSARSYSNQHETFGELFNVKASTVLSSPSHVGDKLLKNIRCYKTTTVKDHTSSQTNPSQPKVSRCSRLDNKISSANDTLANTKGIAYDNVPQKLHQNKNYDGDRSKEKDYNISQSPTKNDVYKIFTKSKFVPKNRENTSNSGDLKYKSNETLIVEDLEVSALESDVESNKSESCQSEHTSLGDFQHNDMKDTDRDIKFAEADCEICGATNHEGIVLPVYLQRYDNRCSRISEEVRETEDTIIKFLKEVKEGDGKLSPRMKSLSTATICINPGHSIGCTENSITYSAEDLSASANVHQHNDCMDNVSMKDFQLDVNIGDFNVDPFSVETCNTHLKNKKITSPPEKLRTSSGSVKFFSGFNRSSKMKGSKYGRKSLCNVGNVPKFQGKCIRDNKQKSMYTESTKPISSDTRTCSVRRTHKFTALPSNLSSSTSKLIFTDDTVKISPRAKRKSQDRFPFTMSKATSAVSSKFNPDCSQPPNLSIKSTPRENAYQLDMHPSIMRLACQGFEETGYDVMKCVTYDQEIGKKKNLVPMMKGFVRKFSSKLWIKSKKHCPTATEGTMQVIYKNKQCREESLENISSDESTKIEPSENLNAAVKPTDLQWLRSDSTDSKSSTASTKVLRKTESCEHITLNLGELPTRRHYNNAWIQDITDQETSPLAGVEKWSSSHGSSGKSTNYYSEQDSKRYSMFLATNSRHTQTPDCPQVTSIVEQDKGHCHKYLSVRKHCPRELADKSSLPKDIQTQGKGKNVPKIYAKDLEGVETGCFCLKFCHLVAQFSTGTMSKNHMSVKQGTSSSRVHRYRLPLWKGTR